MEQTKVKVSETFYTDDICWDYCDLSHNTESQYSLLHIGGLSLAWSWGYRVGENPHQSISVPYRGGEKIFNILSSV